MSDTSSSGIGIRPVGDRSGTRFREQAQTPANDNRADPDDTATDADDNERAKSAPPPGMGKYIDKWV